jgi:hypothetical protein
MKLRLVPRTPDRLREEPRAYPDTIRLRAHESNLGTRYVVEARREGRILGDRAFVALDDARAFAKLECGWHKARLVDETLG